ncbi:thioredoxin family protein [Virgibacillus alimentarius]|uniref:Thiol-disulfide isomerase/thioredoxin n=1 Tax=Virgibacillus alimentarius TaxID=698769 RepID=A0ABS4S8Z1_9BACI|nr:MULTISPECIES: thioredoxin family protein [Virgibacillus]MBP2257344.1 thiol-disulfide isomerase/thioredoxin [Virgibacillus alimentarius]HLR68631.1 thioredoxin family protein [Virgibacillus sp.]
MTNELLNTERYLLYIHTPFCGTCHLARSMLEHIESVHREDIFYEMNASLFSDFMQEAKIESVPCLFIKEENEIKEKIYAFKSIPNIYSYLLKYKPELFSRK